MKLYSVKEIFYTLQGEGAHTGRPAVFCRFSGCNLWTGREDDRKNAICRFCDTDFVGTDGEGGGKFSSADALAAAVWERWPKGRGGKPYVVCTGGEPLLQIDPPLIHAFHQRGLEIAIESNGTKPAPAGIDWICISPKAGSTVVQRQGHEIKLVWPQEGIEPEDFLSWDFQHFFLQPKDGPDREASTANAVSYCLQHPRWRLSLQTHKILRIP